MKNSSDIEPSTFRIVVQRLNQPRHRVPHTASTDFYNRYDVYCAVRNGYLNTIQADFYL